MIDTSRGDFRIARGSVVAAVHGGKSVLVRGYAESPLRLLFPKVAGARSAWVCVTSLGGGLVDGDALELDVEVEEGAALLLTTQASTKAFRGRTRQSVQARVDGILIALPDPVACFAGADYESEIAVTLGPRGAIVLVDSFTSGRPAHGERWAFERFSSRIRIERRTAGGTPEPVVHDATLLDAKHGSIEARFGRVEAYATVIAIGADAVASNLLEPREGAVLCAPSPLLRDAGAIVRIAGERSEDVLLELRRRLRNVAEICGVDPYASRH